MTQLLNYKVVSLSIGIFWAICMFFVGIMATFVNWGKPMVDMMASVYIGFEPTLTGSFIGAAWSFADGLVCGLLFTFIYNKVAKACH